MNKLVTEERVKKKTNAEKKGTEQQRIKDVPRIHTLRHAFMMDMMVQCAFLFNCDE